MADTLNPLQRRKCMAHNRGRDTSPELALRRAVWKRGLRYRLNQKLPGKPDLVFSRARVAVFVDGCFWHGCKQHKSIPEKNRDFWENKLRANMERDRRVSKELGDSGWIVKRYWEHQIREGLDDVVKELAELVAP